MKKQMVLITIMVCAVFLSTYSQDWIWAKSVGGSGIDVSSYSNSINKSTGDLYITGQLGGSAVIFENDTLNTVGNTDIFYGKYDANGNKLWAKRAGGALGGTWYDGDNESGQAIFYDSITNAVYLTGMFNGTMTLGTFTLTSVQRDIFIAKLDIDGNVIWAKKAGGSAQDYPNALCLDNLGNVYVVGSISSTNAMFDTFSVGKGGFFAKYDNNGNCVWAKKISEMGQFSVEDYSIRSINYFNNKLFLTGAKQKITATLDTISVTDSLGYSVVSCFNLSGNILWVKIYGGWVNSSGIDNDGNIYITGEYSDSARFDNILLTKTLNTNYNDVYIAKIDSMDNCVWAHNLNVSFSAFAYDLSSDGIGNVYISGNWVGTANFGNFTVSSQTGNDMFVARYDSSGTCLGVRNFGEAWGYSVVNDNTGSCIVTGVYKNTVNIGTTVLTAHGTSYPDIFIAKHSIFTGIVDEKRMAVSTNNLIIYANPNTGKCTITIPSEFKTETKLTLQIFDNTGHLLQQTPVEMLQDKVSVNITAEAKGVYTAVLSNGKKSYTGKIIFE